MTYETSVSTVSVTVADGVECELMIHKLSGATILTLADVSDVDPDDDPS